MYRAKVLGVAGMVWTFWVWDMKQVGHFGTVLALGVGLSALAGLGLLSRSRLALRFGAGATFALGAALGPRTPLFRLLPLQDRLRFPEKWVALAALAWRFAKRVRALSTLQLSTARHGGWSAYGWTLVSSLPVAILLLIPTALVAITGVFFIPGMFALMHRRLLTERAMLAEA